MKTPWKSPHDVLVCVLAVLALGVSGCGTIGGAASDLGLAGLGGVAGYELSGGKVGGAAIGAATGYVGSKIAQAGVKTAQSDAEQRGYDRALNQAVKQQYWIIQNQQKSFDRAADPVPARYLPVQLPEMKINGVVQNPTTEYLRIDP
jgi:hypothetical protein